MSRKALALGIVSLAASFCSLPVFVILENLLTIYYYSPVCPCPTYIWWVIPALATMLLYPLLFSPVLVFLFFYSIRSRVELSKIAAIDLFVSLAFFIVLFVGSANEVIISPLILAFILTLGFAFARKPSKKSSVGNSYGKFTSLLRIAEKDFGLT